ncbi:hypothetical protein PHET_09845 [Paragonimus heterotremus]|uniref:Uncharacterized protein n=1 Tax=Paragonimus heterotremus TaxID=100268 RepID=A0A8J4WCW3_9TREM|nr:hypothetical protein PHET_09845 [Paragonimus heterotremus]
MSTSVCSEPRCYSCWLASKQSSSRTCTLVLRTKST